MKASYIYNELDYSHCSMLNSNKILTRLLLRCASIRNLNSNSHSTLCNVKLALC